MNVLGWVIVANMCMCFCGAGSEILVSSVSHIFSASRILTHLKRPWCWGRLKVGGEGDDRGWDGWMASLTEWKWVWVNPGSWWWTGRPGMLQSMGSQRVGHNWATELNWRFCHSFFFLKRRQTHAHRGPYKLTISYNKGFLSDLNSLLLYLKKGKVSRSWI